MSKAKPLIFGAVLGASAMFFAQQYHVVQSHDGFQVIPRTPQQSLGLAYADIRTWTPSQWLAFPELGRAMMAHGSTDLISESVSSTLADRVTEDGATLEEMQGLLDGSIDGGKKQTDEDFLNFPALEESGASSDTSGRKKDRSESDVLIPLPKDAKAKILANPFGRSALSEEKTKPLKSDSGSRFAAEELTDDFQEAEFEEVTSSATAPSRAVKKSAAEQANERAERNARAERLFKDAADPSSMSRSTIPSKSAPGSIPKPADTDSMFEEVTTPLENRVQEAFNRAAESVKGKAASAADESAKGSANYVREKAAELVPEAAKSLLNGKGNSSVAPAAAPLLDFDPFLE